VAETWPARMRGLVISADRSTWGVVQTVIIWFCSPEYAGKELDEIAV
jgi:hypothetical protein